MLELDFGSLGIHPFNREALSQSDTTKTPERLYIPLLTPSRSRLSTEEARFESRYAEWLRKNHPEALTSTHQTSSHEQPKNAPQLLTSESLHRRLSFEKDSDSEGDVACHHTTTLSKTLSSMPKPKLKYPQLNENTSNRVLTSEQNLQKIERKEKEKEAKAKEKQKKAEERELRRLQKEEEKHNKGHKTRNSKKPATTGESWFF